MPTIPPDAGRVDASTAWQSAFVEIYRRREACSEAEASFVAHLMYPLLGSATPLSANRAIATDRALGSAVRGAWRQSGHGELS